MPRVGGRGIAPAPLHGGGDEGPRSHRPGGRVPPAAKAVSTDCGQLTAKGVINGSPAH